jgi:Tfp pilus assembly protein PilV
VSIRAKGKAKNSRGFTMVELLVAGFILVSAILGAGLMIIMGMARDNANRIDTTGTNAAQTVLEEIASTSASVNLTVPITDCVNTDITTTLLQINTAVGGANLTSTGDIDFSQTQANVPAGYQMNYTICRSDGVNIVYDVRWRVDAVSTQGFGKVVTVSARQPFVGTVQGIAGITPVTLRTVIGQ